MELETATTARRRRRLISGQCGLPRTDTPKTPRQMKEPWRIEMKTKLETEDAKAHYKRHKKTVEPVFGIIKSAMGFIRFRLRSITKVTTEWTLIALAYNCRRIHRLQAA
jgi:hypothetical protein